VVVQEQLLLENGAPLIDRFAQVRDALAGNGTKAPDDHRKILSPGDVEGNL
jgi:hypothetical protein